VPCNFSDGGKTLWGGFESYLDARWFLYNSYVRVTTGGAKLHGAVVGSSLPMSDWEKATQDGRIA